MEEYVIRFVVGGIVVCAFAALGDVFRQKSLRAFLARPLRSPS